jgi:hypothetical protein
VQEPLGVLAIERTLLGQKQGVGEGRASVLGLPMGPGGTHGRMDVANRYESGQWANGGFLQAGRVAGAVEALMMSTRSFDQPPRTSRQLSHQFGSMSSMILNDSFLFSRQGFLLSQDSGGNTKHANVMN